MEHRSNKTIVLECYRKIIRDLDLSLVDSYIHEDYIQHSPTVKDGRAGLVEMLGFLKSLPKPAEPGPSPIIRAIEDDNMVAVHLDIKFMGMRMAVIDIFRVEDGLIAEHWDAGQVITDTDEGITMTNGSTQIDPAADVEINKKLLADFCADVLVDGNFDLADRYLSSGLIEHNTANSLLSKPAARYKVHRIIGEGDFVVAHLECIDDDKAFVQMHIFRIVAGNIAEHWSVEQVVTDVMAHGNGMF